MNPVVSWPVEAGAWGVDALRRSREARQRLQEHIAQARDGWIHANSYFYDQLKSVLRFVVEPGKRVLDIRCQTGHLLAALSPSAGVGVEISDSMAAVARANYPDLQFHTAHPETLDLRETFDYVIVNHLCDTS